MNDRPRNDDGAALIAGDALDRLGPEERAELALLADLLADPATWAEPRPELEAAVLEAVADARANSPAVASPAPTAAPTRRRARPRAFVAAVAVAAAIVAGIAYVTTSTEASADFTAELEATPLAPAARAAAAITHTDEGFRVVLESRGLPKLRDGEYYEAWLRNGSGTVVPIGTFSEGNGYVTLWAGVSPKEFSTLTVTIERTDNNQSSSGRRVLEGPVHTG
jgi:hypothetical protein